jgi:hydrogenase maturation protease
MQLKTPKFLIIGYGNTLRSDDGVGQVVSMEIEKWNLPQVRSLYLHQLTPELAEKMANFETVIFIDACLNSNQVELKPVEKENLLNNNSGHYCSPEYLLYLTQFLYNKNLQAWLITIPIENLNLGENLSLVAQKGITETLEKIENLIKLT